MTFDKVATFLNNKKKDWFSCKTRLFFVHGNIFKDGSRNFATFKKKQTLWPLFMDGVQLPQG